MEVDVTVCLSVCVCVCVCSRCVIVLSLVTAERLQDVRQTSRRPANRHRQLRLRCQFHSVVPRAGL